MNNYKLYENKLIFKFKVIKIKKKENLLKQSLIKN